MLLNNVMLNCACFHDEPYYSFKKENLAIHFCKSTAKIMQHNIEKQLKFIHIFFFKKKKNLDTL